MIFRKKVKRILKDLSEFISFSSFIKTLEIFYLYSLISVAIYRYGARLVSIKENSKFRGLKDFITKIKKTYGLKYVD